MTKSLGWGMATDEEEEKNDSDWQHGETGEGDRHWQPRIEHFYGLNYGPN